MPYGLSQAGLILPRPSSLQLGIEISGKTMGARGLTRARMTDEGLWKSQGLIYRHRYL